MLKLFLENNCAYIINVNMKEKFEIAMCFLRIAVNFDSTSGEGSSGPGNTALAVGRGALTREPCTTYIACTQSSGTGNIRFGQ
jgi:hypothetical protein